MGIFELFLLVNLSVLFIACVCQLWFVLRWLWRQSFGINSKDGTVEQNIFRFGREIIDKFFLLHNYAELLHNISLTTTRRKKPNALVTVHTEWSLMPSKTEGNHCVVKQSDYQKITSMLTAKETILKNFSELIVPNSMKFFENCSCGKNDFEHAVDHFYVTLKSLDNTLTNPNAFICPKLDWIKLFYSLNALKVRKWFKVRMVPKPLASRPVAAARGRCGISW